MHLAQMAYAHFQSYLAAPTLDPLDPHAPPEGGMADFATSLISWMKWIALVGGVLGMLISAGMFVLGRRNRNALASDGLVGGVWVIGGLSLAATSYGFVDAVWGIA